MLNDQGTGYIEVKWKTDESTGELDKDWILHELYETIMARKFVKYPDGKKNEKGHNGEYQFINKDKPSFIRLNNNLTNMKQSPRLLESEKSIKDK